VTVGAMNASASAPALGGGDIAEKAVERMPMFRLDYGAKSMLTGMKVDGPPERKTWDTSACLGRSDNKLFRLKQVNLPELQERNSQAARYCRSTTSYNNQDLFSHAASQLERSGELKAGFHSLGSPSATVTAPGESPKSTRPVKRADKYFDILMKNHYKRVDGWKDEEENAAKEKATATAAFYARKARERERRKAAAEAFDTRSRSSDEGEEVASEEEPEDLGPLLPFDGKLKVELEICVREPPCIETASTEADSSVQSSRKSSRSAAGGGPDAPARAASSTSGESAPLLDLADELDLLKEEMGAIEEKEKKEDSDDDLPEGLKLKKFQDIWDNPKPKWTLGIGGSVFFVPDAERYAFGPSLPPPPPPSMLGRRRLRLKPRLPLDISNHRYRDEHPNIWPEAPYSPELEDHLRFERTLLTLDLYKSCNMAMTQLPQAERESDKKRHKVQFGKIVERETRTSHAWKEWRHREDLKKKEARRLEREAQKKQAAELAEAYALAAKAKAEADEDALY